MISINILGLKNYRVFDDKDGVLEELSNINILTGANNSGKSSIIKFFQLLKNT
ncbi:AAA family ATPase [Tenacibaculum maritimum]|uniref:AAA family ATPase n=1 Tax=Tenacibaculum maritimum TaxID=107401 RepID=UPI00388F49AD